MDHLRAIYPIHQQPIVTPYHLCSGTCARSTPLRRTQLQAAVHWSPPVILTQVSTLTIQTSIKTWTLLTACHVLAASQTSLPPHGKMTTGMVRTRPVPSLPPQTVSVS